MKSTQVYLLDDHKIVRDGLKSILASHEEFEVSGEESNPENFLSLINELNFDLLILDVSLPKISGIDLIKKVKEKKPASKIVMLSMHDNPEYMFRSIREGANAYLPKDVEATEFVEALKQVMDTGKYYSSLMNVTTKESVALPSFENARPTHNLSNRELEVLSHMSRGKSSREIGESLSLSPRTVETHRVNIMKKLGTSNGAETVAKALKLNLIKES